MKINGSQGCLTALAVCTLGLLLSACGTRAAPDPTLKPPQHQDSRPPESPVIFEREPDGAQILEDEAIGAAVRDELAELGARPTCGMTRIDVDVERGIVVLEGAVPTLLHARVAVEKTGTVRGVRSIINHLRVAPAAITDDKIEADIRSRLDEDPATRDVSMEVSSRLGRVRLSGAAGSFAEKELAAEIAAAVRGVKQIDNDVRIVPEPRSDRDIESDVVARLVYDAYLADDPIDVDVSRGVVSLAGGVGSFMEKRRARIQSWGRGVVAVDDSRVFVDLMLQDRDQRQAQPLPSDAQVAGAVRDALELDPRVQDDVVDVRVRAGIARLSGSTTDLLGKGAAERVAANTIGVWRVENRIAVRPSLSLTDAELVHRVRARIEEDAELHAGRIEIEVKKARVTIRGLIEDPVQQRALTRRIEAVPGVLGVVVDPDRAPTEWAGPGDEILEREIERALWWDSRVDSSTIDVEVREGVATIRGGVRSRAARDAVLENAWSAGPRAVQDQLTLSKTRPPA